MKDLQKEVAKMYIDNGWDTAPELLLIAIQEELGEISGRFLAEHPGYKKILKDTDPIPEEIGDLLTLIFAFCNKRNIDPEKWVKNTIKKRSKQE